MKNLLIIFAVLGLAACDSTPHTALEKEQVWVNYYQDGRTGLCFAGRIGAQNATLTNVPCSPEVLKLVQPMPDFY